MGSLSLGDCSLPVAHPLLGVVLDEHSFEELADDLALALVEA
jgi:hypothetical protein